MLELRTLALAFLPVCLLLAQPAPYHPGRHDDWQRRPPAQAGFDARKLEETITFFQAKETKRPRDLRASHDLSFGREPYGEPLGRYKPRGEMTGIAAATSLPNGASPIEST